MRIRLHRASAAESTARLASSALLARAVVLACAVVAASPIAAHADTTSTVGWVRLAQLSPTTASADVYLSPAAGSSAQSAQPVLAHAAYGALSQYQPVAPGDYTVAMRAAGAPATTDPLTGTQLTVAAGQSYTVAAFGAAAAVKLQVLNDELNTPPGQAGVRVIEASQRNPTASVSVGADPVATNLRAPTATQYQPVTPGASALIVTTAAVTQTISANLAANSAYSLVILDGAQAQDMARVLVVTDSSGISAMPKGGVSTGFGGTSRQAATSSSDTATMALWGLLAAAGLVVLSLTARNLTLTAKRRRSA